MKYLRKGKHCNGNEIVVKDENKEFVAFEIEKNMKVKINVAENSNLLLSGITKSSVENLEFEVTLNNNSKFVWTFNLGSLSQNCNLKIRFKTGENVDVVINNLIDGYGSIDFDLAGEVGEGSECFLNNIVSTGTREIDSKVKINVYHTGSNSKNEINLAGVINSKSKCDFTGEIFIPENLSDVNSSMNAKFLCYEGASVSTLPILRIESKHVKTSHGISVINVDSKKVEYLMSRGLSEEEANEVLKVGSLSEMLDSMANSFKKAGVQVE